MALGELTSYEKKNQYYANIQLGRDVKAQTDSISQSTKAMIASQIASANAIVASQESIREGIDDLSYGISEVSEGIQGLKAAFEFGISEVVWQIEQNREVLQNILNVLMAPLDTQSKELRRRAEDAYANGWFDEALEDFLESEKKNKYDFSVHISLGMLYLFQKVDRSKAYESFEKAVKYAKPKSKYHASLSLLHLALIKRDMNFIEEAENLTAEAIQLTPDFAEALYQNAQYNGKLKKPEKCIQSLQAAIKIDKLYCLKAGKDEMFDSVRSHVNALFDKLRSNEAAIAERYFNKIKQKHDKFMPILRDISRDNIIEASSFNSFAIDIDHSYNNLNTKRSRNSYFDFLDINEEMPLLQNKQDSLIQRVKDQLSGSISTSSHKIIEAKNDYKSSLSDYLGATVGMIILGSFAVPIIGILLLFPGWSKFYLVIFVIPLLSQFYSGCLVYNMVTDSSAAFFSRDLISYEHTLSWFIIVFLIGSVGYYIISLSNSKSQMSEVVSNNTKRYEETSPYLERLKDL